MESLRDIMMAWRGDFGDRPLQDGRLALTDVEQSALEVAADTHLQEAATVCPQGATPIAACYGARICQRTSCSFIVNVGDCRFFILHKRRSSCRHRWLLSLLNLSRGLPLWKPVGPSWKKLVESRSLVPTFDWAKPNFVATPFVESVNACDLFRHRHELRDLPASLKWVGEATQHDLLDIVTKIGELLAVAHRAGRPWGEAILENVIVDAQRRTMLVDPETVFYVIPTWLRREHDLRMLVDSVTMAFAAAGEPTDRTVVEKAVRRGYTA